MSAACTVYLVRHAEKQAIPGDKDPALTEQGQARAQALAARLAGEPIQTLYATRYRRTQLTLTPLAERLGKAVQIYDAQQSGTFLKNLLGPDCAGAVIVAGHSNTLPELLRAAGIDEPASEFDESRYGELFIVERQQLQGRWQARLKTERFGD